MMLCRKDGSRNWWAGALLLSLAWPSIASADPKYAVVPNATIYPGDTISQSLVTSVAVTNPNIAPGYASEVDDVVGKVTKRTLIAGRTIPLSVLREPFTVKRGTSVRLTFSSARMVIAARGSSMQDAMAGDVVRVRNLDTGVMVSGTVMADGSVEVMVR
jgi:flagella basal body P-ring formation protein FlgA